MMPSSTFVYQDDPEVWLTDILGNHYEEARARALALRQQGGPNENGCIESNTAGRRRTRFRGRQVAAYRLIYCVLNQRVASFDDVVRHRCNNPRCMNPDHLEIGSRADNRGDDRDFAANGLAFELL